LVTLTKALQGSAAVFMKAGKKRFLVSFCTLMFNVIGLLNVLTDW